MKNQGRLYLRDDLILGCKSQVISGHSPWKYDQVYTAVKI